MTVKKPLYKRILFKMSGEALMGSQEFGIDPKTMTRMATEIKELVNLGVQVGLVVGGGNLFRGEKLATAGMNRVVSDQIGMLATVMNGLAMRDALVRSGVKTKLMSSVDLKGVCESYNWADAIGYLEDQKVVIFAAGTGNPFCTTDSASCLRGIEVQADIVLKGTSVDGVYDKDPNKFDDAKLYEKIDYATVLSKELKVMDLSAFTMARDYQLPIYVFNMNKEGMLKKVIMGENVGTLIK